MFSGARSQLIAVCASESQVYLRRGKLLLALQAVKRALQVSGASHPQVHCLAVRFCQAVAAQQVHPFPHITLELCGVLNIVIAIVSLP